MKVLLLADLQLEGGLSLGHGEYGPGSRFHDQEQALHQIADIADAEDVELAILAGDTFDRPKPSPWAILAMQEFFSRMPKVLCLMGNHDCKSLALPSVLECLRRPGAEIVDRPWTFQFDGLHVSCLPWMPLSAVLGPDAGETSDRDEQNALAGAKLANTVQGLGAHDCPDGARHILVAHWSVGGATTNAGVGVEVFREPIIPFPAPLTTAGFDMVALGHIHRIQVLSQEPPVLYLGSPLVGNFGDAGSPHGIWIYESEKPEMRFVPVADREFVTYDVDFTDGGDFSMLLEGYDPRPGDWAGAVVRIRYTLTEEQARTVDVSSVKAAAEAAGAHKVFVQPQLIRGSRARVGSEGASDLTPDRAVQVFLDTTDGSPEQAARAREMHAEYVGRVK